MSIWRVMSHSVALVVLYVLLCWGAAAQDSAQESSDPVQAASAAYQERDFATAVSELESALEERGPDADIYFNLGMVHEARESLPDAILAYERAAALSPTSSDALERVSVVREALQTELLSASTERELTRGEPPSLVWWRFFRSFGADIPSWLLLGSWVLAFGLLTGRRWVSQPAVRDSMMVGAVACLLAALLFGVYLGGQVATEDTRPGIVMQERPLLYESPSDLATTDESDDLYRGTTVLITQERQGWFEIQLPDGTKGWIPDASVAEVMVLDTE